MTYSITSLTAAPHEREPLETMLHDYMNLMLAKLAAIGGPQMTSQQVLSGLWEDLTAIFRPGAGFCWPMMRPPR